MTITQAKIHIQARLNNLASKHYELNYPARNKHLTRVGSKNIVRSTIIAQLGNEEISYNAKASKICPPSKRKYYKKQAYIKHAQRIFLKRQEVYNLNGS